MNSFFTDDELKELGLCSYGDNVYISKKVSIYGAENISIGNNVRIDDFCILSGKISIGNYVHISAACLLHGGTAGIEINDFAGISSRSAVYALSDDFSGEAMIGAMLPVHLRNVHEQKVFLRKYVQVGTGCTILPGVDIGEGSSVGSMSLVNKSLDSWGIYVGIPARKIKDRSKRILELEEKFKDLQQEKR